MQMRGHLAQSLEQIHNYLEVLDAKYNFMTKPNQPLESLFFKLVFMKAQIQKKVCLLTECDTTCMFLVDHCKTQSVPQLWHKYAVKAAYLKV